MAVLSDDDGVSVGVLIVNYRTYAALDRCLASLQPYLGAGDDVVVVDWVSDDRERGPLEAQYPGVRWLASDENLGFSGGINRAAAVTRCDVLLWLNPDTELLGPVVRELEGWLQSHPEVGIAGPRVLNADGTVQPSARRFPGVTTVFGGRSSWMTRHFPKNWFSRRNLLHGDGTHPARVDWISGACLATRRETFERLEGLDEAFFMYWEDADYCRRAARLGLGSAYVPTSAVRHTGGVSSAHNVVPSIRAFHRSAFRLFAKHGGAARIFAPVVWLGLRVRAEFKVALRYRARP